MVMKVTFNYRHESNVSVNDWAHMRLVGDSEENQANNRAWHKGKLQKKILVSYNMRSLHN